MIRPLRSTTSAATPQTALKADQAAMADDPTILIITGVSGSGKTTIATALDHEPPEVRHYKSKLDLIDFCPLSGHGGYRRIVQCLPRQPSIRASHIRSMRPRQANRMVRLIHRQILPQGQPH